MANTYEYTGINESATISLLAASALSEVNGKAVVLGANGVALPAAGDDILGIVLLTEDENIAAGGRVNVQIKDIGPWKAAAAFDQGALLATDATGCCKAATSGQHIVARALEAATAAGDLVKVQLLHAGTVA